MFFFKEMRIPYRHILITRPIPMILTILPRACYFFPLHQDAGISAYCFDLKMGD